MCYHFAMSSRIVIDTSVFISALIGPQGPSRSLIRKCLLGQYRPIMGNALFLEYESVLGRQEMLQKCPLTLDEIRDLLAALMGVSEWVNIYYLWRPNLRDEADNHLIELAIAGHASMIATNNLRDFRSPELLFPELRILTPEQILRG
jgi:putative PIN family toxin of toxin-antitoxin system